ncbi:hypothetical protein N7474_010237 [Penicillium riverlandense]|uniref:uncharacterized protein n=1 Tax=Penicillium riverlandense TaxID=1903569 RepID=UPI002549BA50|nr:uncharacterized protein N7474_010237 [Penicillium riverlandense]KAJ5808968.1 hypothetical protein N7474_010237 [Penicillium riverlandense]
MPPIEQRVRPSTSEDISAPRSKYQLVSYAEDKTQAYKQVVALEQKLDCMVSMLSASHRSSPHDRSDDLPREPQLAPADELIVVPNFEEGARSMEVYLNQMVPLFPFVVIPPGTTPEALYQEKPFLYRTITMVACKNGTRQREMAKSGRKYLAEHIVTNVESSLDLLQGLVVHVAWFVKSYVSLVNQGLTI